MTAAAHADDADRAAERAEWEHRRRRRRLWAEHRSLRGRLTPAEIATATRHQLIVMFRPLALSEAARFGDGSEDAVGDAMLGLAQAAKSFDPARGAFLPWARRYIRQAIRRGTHSTRSHIRIPASRRQALARLYLAAESTGAARGSPKAMADRSGLTSGEIERLLAAPRVVVTADTDMCGGRSGDDRTEPSTPALDTERMIECVEDQLGARLPDDLADRLRWWIRHDGSTRALRPIRTAILQLATA